MDEKMGRDPATKYSTLSEFTLLPYCSTPLSNQYRNKQTTKGRPLTLNAGS